MGIQTHADALVLGFTDEQVEKQIKNENLSYNENFLKTVMYRPFDARSIYNDSAIVQRPRAKLNQNFDYKNFCFCFMKQYAYEIPYSYAFITNTRIIDRIFISNKGAAYFAPLFIKSNSSFNTELDNQNIEPNFKDREIKQISQKLGLNFNWGTSEIKESKLNEFNSLELLDYIYAIIHSPTYRNRYKEFLKIDFPRIPITSDKKLFWRLVEKGKELRQLHLLNHKLSNNLITKFNVAGDNNVKSIKFQDNRVWINEKQYFDGVSQIAWKFYIGGYQPAQKWLKIRKDKILSLEDIIHYQKIIVALQNTDRIMKEIDKCIKSWPIK
jgi:predicted helicase